MATSPPRRQRLWQAVRLLAACALAGGVAALVSLPEWYWALITAAVVMQSDLSHTLTAARDRVFATLVGAVVGVVLIYLRQRGLPELPLFAAGLVPLAVLIAWHPAMRLTSVTLIVVFLIPGASDPYSRAAFRVVDILVGSLSCAIVSFAVASLAGRDRREPA